jgi:hypothetical protein
VKLFLKIFFSFTKSENKRTEQVLLGALVPVGVGRMWGKGGGGEYGANTVYTCMYMENETG